MSVTEKFLKYVKISTGSDPDNENSHPSAKREFDLAEILCGELKELGCSNVICTDKAYVYAYLPATEGCEKLPKVGFIAHLDTSPDCSGENVKPIMHENYNGDDIVINGITISPSEFPSLKEMKGKTVITADGTTLLGADDKAGVAEIMELIQRITENKLPHGKIGIAFTPDEEIGSGADFFDVEAFDCNFAYTVDGEVPGEVVYENFNAASAVFTVKGKSVHPGSAKNTMINAALVATEINGMLPSADIPALTEGREGFYHLCGIEGDVSFAKLQYIVRDHDSDMYEARLKTLRHIEKTVNEKYGENTAALVIKEQYRNMIEKIQSNPKAVEIAKKAVAESGLTVSSEPIRGGTDGARLSFMGLPTPNLGTGGYAFHGLYEHIAVEDMELCVKILENIVKLIVRG